MTKHSPTVTLGAVAPGTVAPGMLLMVERGVRLRPELAREPGVIRLRSREGWPSVLIELGATVHVSDDEETHADVEITATLPDLIALLRTPLTAGVPNPVRREGRAALGTIYRGEVEITGLRSVGRRLLRLLSLT